MNYRQHIRVNDNVVFPFKFVNAIKTVRVQSFIYLFILFYLPHKAYAWKSPLSLTAGRGTLLEHVPTAQSNSNKLSWKQVGRPQMAGPATPAT